MEGTSDPEKEVRANAEQGVVDVVLPTFADVLQEERTAEAAIPHKEKGTVRGHSRCDFCNKTIFEDAQEEHVQCQHAGAMDWMRRVRAEGAKLCQEDARPETVNALGLFVLETVVDLDKGRDAFRIIQSACKQLNRIVSTFTRGSRAFLFGGCAAFGSWDGVGDADFTVIESRHFLQLAKGEDLNPDEVGCILRIASSLRSSGFLRSELEPVIRTRVPVVKRVQKMKGPPLLKRNSDGFKIVCDHMHPLHERVLDDLKSRGIGVEDVRPNQFTLHFKDPFNAVSFFCANDLKRDRVYMQWKQDHPLPEIFSLDFDVSCRPLGVRNSLFMRQYLSQSPVARAGLAFLKRWSKQTGINNAMKGYLTSYAIMILWVSFLLSRGDVVFVDPASQPPLSSLAVTTVEYIPLLSDDGEGGGFMGNLSQCPALKDTLESLGSCVMEFFCFYVKFEWEKFVVTLRNPSGCELRGRLGWLEENEVMTGKLRDRVWYRMCIEDPYESNLNLGRHLSPNKCAYVRTQFVVAVKNVLDGSLKSLILDNRERACAELHALLHRAVYEEGLMEMSISEARDYVISKAGAEILAYYEICRCFDSLYEILTYTRKKDQKNCPDSKKKGIKGGWQESDEEEEVEEEKEEYVNDALEIDAELNASSNADKTSAGSSNGGVRSSKSLHSCVREVDEKLSHSDGLGIPQNEVPAAVRDAYLFACGRAFRTVDERDALQLHVNAISRVLGDPPFDYKKVSGAVRDILPTEVRDEALIQRILESPEMDGVLQGERRLQPAAPDHIVRRRAPLPAEEPVRRGKKSKKGQCSECKKRDINVWATTNRRKDNGKYCDDCWKSYEKTDPG